jgi:putative transcriptional regulator
VKNHYATIALDMRKKHRKVLRLRQLRRARELTQVQIARKVGIHVNAYNAIETGRSTPSLDTARSIAGLFGQPVEQVFEYVEVPA